MYNSGLKNIQMVDLRKQYDHIKSSVDAAIQDCIDSTNFIKGPQVDMFERAFETYLNVNHVISCGNGTDALQISIMSLGLKPGDEVIIPAFTYVATAEVIGLLGLTPVLVDVNPKTFNINCELVAQAITPKTRLIIPVHLFGQCAEMEGIVNLCKANKIAIIEDNAQAIGAVYKFQNGQKFSAGAIGDIGTTSFFPSKNLGCYGDGGAIYTNNGELARRVKMIANHGQVRKYVHEVIGVNSRLDTIQAAILNEKLKYLDYYISQRQKSASYYDKVLSEIADIEIPYRDKNSTHVFHQYTIKVLNGQRDDLKLFLENKNIQSMIYYPIPLDKQGAFRDIVRVEGKLSVTEELCNTVLSIPIHTEQTELELEYISHTIKSFFN